jgi:hypothetical protein
MPLSRTNLGSKSEKDLAGLKRSKSAVKLQEDEATVVVDVTRLHRKEVRVQPACLFGFLVTALRQSATAQTDRNSLPMGTATR